MFPPTMKFPALLLAFCAATLCVRAALVTKTITYEQAGAKLESFLVYDNTTTALRPGVLVFPEWWGLNDYAKDRARQLAQLGYVALAVDMYGGAENTLDPKQAGAWSGQFYGKPLMAERARAALDQLLQTGLVDSKRVAAIGFCFGGAVCQALAYSGAPLVGIVSFHGSLIPAPADAAAKTKAKFLICHGALDPFTKPEALMAFKESLDAAKIDYQLEIYSGALHSFTNPDADAIAAKTGLKGIGYNAEAARHSWALMRQFFGEILAAK